MRSFKMATPTVAVLFGLWQFAYDANASEILACDTQADCPKCATCIRAGYWWGWWKNSWGRCVYDATNTSGCRRDFCNTGVCTAIDTCEMIQRPDQNNIKCGNKKWCRNGSCAELGGINISGDLSMRGLQGQRIDWSGEDGGWYVLISDTADVQISVRLTAPLAREFPELQLITALAMKYNGGHSIVIETKHPYTTQTEGCLEVSYVPCLAENSLLITVDGEIYGAEPIERAFLPGGALITASNLPDECRPSGGHRISTDQFARVRGHRSPRAGNPFNFPASASGGSASNEAPIWCARFLEGAGVGGKVRYDSKNANLEIDTPAMTVRLHHGTNHQGGEVLEDGRVSPDLEFWLMDMHLEWYVLNTERVTGILGETMRPVLDAAGVPVMSGKGAMRGEVEDYRISGPLETDFKFFHE